VTNNPLRYTDPSGHMRIQDGPQQDKFKQSVADKYVPKPKKKDKDDERGRRNTNDGEISNVAAMATTLDTISAALNGAYAIVGDIVILTCPHCELAVLAGYQYYSYIPNSISTISMGLWVMDGVATGENDITISQNSVSISVSQDTLLAAGTNLAGWTVLREPNAAFLVDAGVAGYDYARLGMIPFVDYTLPAFINPTLTYSTSRGFDFSWQR
jgi:hypothetical protein